MVSPRVAVARAAVRSAGMVRGVVGLTSGPHGRYRTRSGADAVEGAAVAAGAGRRYDVALGLVAAPVPLLALGEEVRLAVRAAARAAGDEALLGCVDVDFLDIEATA